MKENCIVLTAYNRPDYLWKVLESVRLAIKAGPGTEWEIAAGLDLEEAPLGVHQETVRVFQNFLVTHAMPCHAMPVTAYIPPTHLGVNKMRAYAGNQAILRGAKNLVHIEDDTVLSADALVLASWWFALPETRRSRWLNLFSRSTPERIAAGPEDPGWGEIHQDHLFCPWGWCCTAENFLNFQRHFTGDGTWDTCLHHWLRLSRQNGDAPEWSRVSNIGALNGTHYTPETHAAEFASLTRVPDLEAGKRAFPFWRADL